MKNFKFVIIGFFLLMSYSTSAQNFGLKTGVLFNNVYIKDIPPFIDIYSPKMNIGFTFGLVYKNRFNRIFSLKSEVGFSRKGFNTGIPAGVSFETDIKYSYIDFAVVGLFNVFEKIRLEFGVEPSYLLDFNEGIFEKNHFNKYELGLIGGASFFINEKIEILARCYFGITPIIEISNTNNAGENSENYGYFNRNFELAIGYYF